MRIVEKMVHRLEVCKGVFLDGMAGERHFDPVFCEYLM